MTMTWKIETISIVTLSGMFALALLLAVIFFAGIVADHSTMIGTCKATPNAWNAWKTTRPGPPPDAGRQTTRWS